MFLRVFLSKTYLFLFSKKETYFKHSPPPPYPKKIQQTMWAPCAPFHSHKSHLEFFFLPSPVEQRFSASFRMHIPSWHAHVPAESLRSNLETNSATHSLCQWCCRVESGVETQDFKDSRILKSPEKNEKILQLEFLFCFFLEGEGTRFPLING